MTENSKNTKKAASKDETFNYNFITKIFAPIKILFKLHLKVAKEELKKDFSRYLTGVFFLILALISLLMFGILLNFIIVMIFKNFVFNFLETDYSYLFSILSAAGINLFFIITGFMTASASFKKPLLAETRKVVEETIKELK